MKDIRNVSSDITIKKTVTYEAVGAGTENNRQQDLKVVWKNLLT